MKNLRASLRAIAGIMFVPAAVSLAVLQGAVIGPLTGNYTAIPNVIYNTLRRVFGYKIEFNAASAPLVKDKGVWFLANHMSTTDFIVTGSALKGTFAGKADILKWPGIAQLARAIKFIGIRRKSEFNPESRGKIAKNFNAGFNTIMFPEGTTNDGKKVYLFRAALLTLLYGDKSTDKHQKPVVLQKEVIVQPIAIRVKEVNGKPADGNDKLRDLYSMKNEDGTLRRIWKRMQLRRTTLELTVFPPLNPKDFEDAKALANRAALDIASVINPGQTTFEKASIPGAAAQPAVKGPQR